MIIDGKTIATNIREELHTFIGSLQGRAPCLAVFLVGNNPASEIYVNSKAKACEAAGIRSIKKLFPENVKEEELLRSIEEFNCDDTIDGILVQLPLPPHIDPYKITLAISPDKDVDGFHPLNVGNLLIGKEGGFIPCTPLGIRVLLEKSKIETRGKHAVVVGRSAIVGKPMAALLMQKGPYGDATVTVAHSLTSNLKKICLEADILIASIGKPHCIRGNMVKEGAVVIDVGVNRIEDSSKAQGFRVVGDVAFDEVKDKCSWITPVPGGVGPMTIAMLLSNTVESYRRRRSLTRNSSER